MALGIRVDPELELQLDQVAPSQSAVIRDQSSSWHWGETVPDWTDWTA